ncbi:Longitudinals lacking protein, partial [Gonioctena quinquepunctata]
IPRGGGRCPSCSKVLSKGSLYTHVKYVCGKEKTFKCPYCNSKSKIKYDMKKHVSRIHPNYFEEFINMFDELYCHA